jgi:predicted nucleotidyltransferase
MRLTENQVAAIRQAVADTFGAGAQVWLFGSRVDDNKRGGDINLLVHPGPEVSSNLLLRKIRLFGQLERLWVNVRLISSSNTMPILVLLSKLHAKLGSGYETSF